MPLPRIIIDAHGVEHITPDPLMPRTRTRRVLTEEEAAARLADRIFTTPEERRNRRAPAMSVARLMINARSELGLGQREMASRLGVSQSFISKVENGGRFLDPLQFREIAAMIARRRVAEFVAESNREGGSWPETVPYNPCDTARALASVEALMNHSITCVQCLAYAFDTVIDRLTPEARRRVHDGAESLGPIDDDEDEHEGFEDVGE